ncbi:hypothetical protein MMC09_004644 [Bachmanniomyces sp. S44760]|nr:hypothetical protein [Bachmanniomyces sp. S44760]
MTISATSISTRANGVSILRAHSPNNTASVNTLTGSLQDIQAAVSSVYSGSKVEYFDFQSTYQGCALPTEASTAVPETCTISFTGFKAAGGSPVAKDCTYSGTAAAPALALCSFGSAFTAVTSVNLTVKSATVLPVLYLDDCMYSTYSKS